MSKALSSALLTGTSAAPGDSSDDRLMLHRFGVNYVPSRNWYYCWNDWHPDDIARDFDQVAEIGADHIRIMCIWPWFQPNPATISTAHLDRLDEMLHRAAGRNLDVLVTLYNGWLSGYRFQPVTFEDTHYDKDSFYTSPKWRAMQDLYLDEVSSRMVKHANFMGFDIGNEIACCWACQPSAGDPWMKRVFQRMHELSPGRIHVNGMDHSPWFGVNTFSAESLMDQQNIVALHAWPFWTGAEKYGNPLEKPYTQLPAAMAALARSLGNAPRKPVWMEEFGVCNVEMPADDVPKWMELAVTGGVEQGISYFTWWASHDIDRCLDFHPFEYDLGLISAENKIKEPGRMFKRLADAYRGKAVVIPDKPLPPPPAERGQDAAWRWLLDFMEWKA
jgi:endo-1,4-beta-mannosidase